MPQPPRPPLDPLAAHTIRFTDPQVTNHTRNAQSGGEVCHEGRIRRRGLAEIVPGMGHEQLGGSPLPCCKAVQTHKERHTVGSTGDTHHHSLRPEAMHWQAGGEGREKSHFRPRHDRFDGGHTLYSGLRPWGNEMRKLGDSAVGRCISQAAGLTFRARKRH